MFAVELASNSSIPSLLGSTLEMFFFPKDTSILYCFERSSVRSAAFPAPLGALFEFTVQLLYVHLHLSIAE